MIEHYIFGRLAFSGVEHTSDVIIHGGRVTSWWRITGHSVAREDVAGLVAESPAVIVVGTGASGMMDVPEDTRRYIESSGSRLVIEKTAQAVEEFNRLLKEEIDVAAALHLTC